MKRFSMICAGLMLVMAAGCSSDDDGGGSGGSAGGGGKGGSAGAGGSGATSGSGGSGGTAGSSGGASGGGGASGASGGAAGSSGGAAGAAGSGGNSAQAFEEENGLIGVEAEHFADNDDQGKKTAWYFTSPSVTPGITPDPDPNHADGAASQGYLEILPDTRVTDADKLISGENFFGKGGDGPMLSYDVYFNTPGKYIVWVRAYSTGGEDNGIHVGIDGTWPTSGEKLQFCAGKNKWTWSSAQRDSGGSSCGQPKTVSIDVPSAGMHTVSFSAREDGFEFDKWILAKDTSYEPQGDGPAEKVYQP